MKISVSDFMIDYDAEGNTWLCMLVDNKEANKFMSVKKSRPYTAELKPRYEKRSLNANRYFWMMVDSYASVTGLKKYEIYRQIVRNIPGVCCETTLANDRVDDFVRAWKLHGSGSEEESGWFCDVEPSVKDGESDVRAYIGSSYYNAQQMAKLIDGIREECHDVGIADGYSDKEIQQMVEAYGS